MNAMLETVTTQERLRAPRPIRQFDSAGRLITVESQPSPLDLEAADLIDTLILERDEARARAAKLQSKLWTVLKDNRDITAQSAGNAQRDLEWAKNEGLNSHLPTIEEVVAAGPYVRVGWDESYEEACARGERDRAFLPPTAPDSEVHNDGGMNAERLPRK